MNSKFILILQNNIILRINRIQLMLEPITAPKIPENFHVKLRERFFNALQAQ